MRVLSSGSTEGPLVLSAVRVLLARALVSSSGIVVEAVWSQDVLRYRGIVAFTCPVDLEYWSLLRGTFSTTDVLSLGVFPALGSWIVSATDVLSDGSSSAHEGADWILATAVPRYRVFSSFDEAGSVSQQLTC